MQRDDIIRKWNGCERETPGESAKESKLQG